MAAPWTLFYIAEKANVKIKSVHVRHFRSIEQAELVRCGGLNVLIGKNNAGKSNLLSVIEHSLHHLRRGAVAAPWSVRKPIEEFTDRNKDLRIQFGVEFDLPNEVNEKLRAALTEGATLLSKSILEQIKDYSSLSFIIAAATEKDSAFLYVEQIGVGDISDKGEAELTAGGIRLLTVPSPGAAELNQIYCAAAALRKDLDEVQALMSDRRRLESRFRRPKDDPTVLLYELRLRIRPAILNIIEGAYRSAESVEEFLAALAPLVEDLKGKAATEAARETNYQIETFAGAAKTPPPYATWLMQLFGSVPTIHFGEEKQRIGRNEAEGIIQLKTKRGGPQQLDAVQSTVEGLLGVQIDAFRDEEGGPAEMDVDQFLVDANGAGIREALRIVLDLELKHPELVLIEEPEVHLHPGLARVVANYLRQASSKVQMFVTTHSTEFVDSVSFQNAYLISKDGTGKTACQLIEAEDEALQIPAEIGLRLSTVFMFDRLLFVEGPSDEAVLRLFAQKLGVDLTKCNLGFVHMGGVRNFAHFAADTTLDLLSRRQVKMWFVTDHDEMEDEEVKRMMQKLGPRAHLKVLRCRELENYLLNVDAIATFIGAKFAATKKPANDLTRATVEKKLDEAITSLKTEVARLRLEKRLLAPVYLQSRDRKGTADERIKASMADLESRLKTLDEQRKKVEAELDECWNARCAELAPGTKVLEKVASDFGVKFSKENGDGEKLAALIPPEGIAQEIKALLEEVTAIA